MQKIFNFAVDNIHKIDLAEYDNDEFAVAKMGYLSTKPNSHGLKISEDVLRQNAASVLNKWLVADMTRIVDAGTHTKNEKIVGRIPKEQDVEFVYDADGYLRAYVDVVISKIYAKDFCQIFENDNNRSVSVEMQIFSNENDENLVESFNIVGVTTLGKQINPSCPDSDITFIRFSDEEADKFFNKIHTDNFALLKQFAKDRQYNMAESKTYKIDKSKEAMSTDDWSNVDKTAMRNKIMDAANRDTLVKSVYLDVRDGWQDAPSSNLKYPIMELKGDTFVYNRNALSAAKGYAEKNNETEVLKKLNSIYKKLDLDGKGDDTNMSDVKFDEIEGRKAWGEVIDKVQEHEGKDVYVDSVEDDHIIYTKDDVRYRVEADIDVDDDDKTVDVDIKWDTVKKDEDQKMAEMESQEEVSMDEMKAKVDELTKEIENRDNIIMEKDKELEELRAFKADIENKEKMSSIDAIMNEVKSCLSEQQFNDLKEEGVNCEMSQIDGWKNKVKAVCFDATKGQTQGKNDVWAFAAPATIKSTPKTAIERLKEQLGE